MMFFLHCECENDVWGHKNTPRHDVGKWKIKIFNFSCVFTVRGLSTWCREVSFSIIIYNMKLISYFFTFVNCLIIWLVSFFCSVAVNSQDVLTSTVPITVCDPLDNIPPSNTPKYSFLLLAFSTLAYTSTHPPPSVPISIMSSPGSGNNLLLSTLLYEK